MSARFCRFFSAFALASAFAFVTLLPAAPKEWKGENGNANDNGKWVDGTAPGNSDHAKISNGKMTVIVPVQFLTLEFTGGTIDGTSSLTLTSAGSVWTGGEVTAATLSLAGATIGTGAAKKVNGGGKLSLGGTTQWTADSIDIGGGATVENRTGATFSNEFDGTIVNSGSAAFKNFGAFQKTGGTGTTDIQAAFENTGSTTVAANKGTLKFSGGGSSSAAGNAISVGANASVRIESQDFTFDATALSGDGTFDLASAKTTFKGASGSGKVKVAGGTAAFDGSNSTLASLALESGSVTSDTNGGANVGSLAWTGGTLNGKVTVSNDGSIGAGNSKFITGGELTLSGTTTWDGSGITASNSAKIKNSAAATFDITGDGSLSASTGAATFTNQGALKKSGGTSDSELHAELASTGSIEVEANNGTLKLHGGGSSSGTGNAVTLGTNAKLRIQDNNFTFDATALSGDGTVELAGATTTFKGASGNGKVSLNGGNAAFDTSASTLASLAVSSGTVTSGTGGAANIGSLAWTGGSLNGKVTVSDGGSISAGNSKFISGGELTLSGNTTWDGSGITASNSAKIKNSAASTFDITGDGSLSASTGAATFTNQGALKKSGGTGNTELHAELASTGFIEVEANNGTLKLHGGGSSAGTGNAVTLGTNAKLRIQDNNFTFDATALSGDGTLELAGATTTFKGASGSGKISLNGGNAAFDASASNLASLAVSSGTVTSGTGGAANVGSLAWTGGSLNGKVTVSNGGSIGAGNSKFISGGELTLSGNTTWDGSGITASNSAKIKNSAASTFDITGDGSLSAATGAAAFTNRGALKKSGGTGNTELHAELASTGSIEVAANKGTLKLHGGGSSSGTGNAVTLGTNAKLRIQDNDFTFDATALSGDGTIELAGATTTFRGASGSGKVHVNGGVANFNGSATALSRLTLGNGTVTSSSAGSLNVTDLDWQAGEITAADLNASNATIGVGGTKKLNHGAKLTLSGNSKWQAETLTTDNGAEIANAGTFDIEFDGTLAHGGGVARGKFVNQGTLNKNGSAASATEIQTIFENAGTANVHSGKLKLAGSGKNKNGAKIDVADDAELEIDGDFTLESLSQLKGNGLARFLNGILDASGTIDIAHLDFDGGQLKGSQKIRGLVNWHNGHWSSATTDYTTTVDVGASLHLRNGNGHAFDRRDIVNNGTVTWHAGNISSTGGSFLNASIFNDSHGGSHSFSDASASFTNNGQYYKSGNGTTTVAVPFVNNNGGVFVHHGTLRFSSTFHQTAGTLFVAGGAILKFDQGLNFEAGLLTGSGTIEGNVVNAGLLSPGSSPGTLTITGNLTLVATSLSLFELSGTARGVSYDAINVSGTAALDGTLSLAFTNNFHTSVLPTHTFTVLTAKNLSGAFANVANGGRLFSIDGLGSFQVNYGSNSIFATDSVVLSNFVPVPEPSTWALLIGGLGVLAALVRRRGRR